MTPDYVFPGSGALLAHKLGLEGVPALDIRQQCAAMLFGLQIVDGLDQERRRADHPLRRRRGARRLHAVGGLGRARPGTAARRPRPSSASAPTSTARSPSSSATAPARSSSARPTATRACAAMKLHTDGGAAKLLYVEGGGFRTRPYWKHTDFDEQKYIPTMDGRELFKFAVTKLPESARALCAETKTPIDSIDWFLAHQANARINDYVREQLGVPAEKLPVEHRALRQHERRDAAHPHRRADARGQAEARRPLHAPGARRRRALGLRARSLVTGGHRPRTLLSFRACRAGSSAPWP